MALEVGRKVVSFFRLPSPGPFTGDHQQYEVLLEKQVKASNRPPDQRAHDGLILSAVTADYSHISNGDWNAQLVVVATSLGSRQRLLRARDKYLLGLTTVLTHTNCDADLELLP